MTDENKVNQVLPPIRKDLRDFEKHAQLSETVLVMSRKP